MSQYGWIFLNNIEYDWIGSIYLKNQSAEYARILNVNISDAAHSIKSLHKLLSSYWDKETFRPMWKIQDGVSYKRMLSAGAQQAQETEAHRETLWSFTLKTTFWIENLSQRWTQSGPFIPKSGHFSSFACICVAEYDEWLHMHQYPWICLNNLENAWINYSGYARALNM